MKNLFVTLIFISITNIINAQWQSTNGPPGGSVTCFALKDSIIFARGGSGGLYMSNNNGDSWNIVSGFPYYGIKALAIDGANIYAGTIHGVYLSTDIGTSWSQVNNGLTDTNITSLAINGVNIFAGTYSNGIFLSANNCASWLPVNTGLTNPYIKTLIVNGLNIYAGTSWWNGGVFLSTDTGSHWTLLNNGLPAEDIRAIAINGTNIFAGYLARGVYISTNNGANWVQANNGLSDTTIRSFAVKGSTIFAGTVIDGVFLSNDNGANWSLHSEGFIGNITVLGLATNDKYIFAAGANGVWRRLLKDLITSYNVEINTTISHINVYPNPAKDLLTIEYNKTENYSEDLLFEVYDLMGKKLMESAINPNHNTIVSIAALSQGIYLYKFVYKNKIVEKDKLVIIK